MTILSERQQWQIERFRVKSMARSWDWHEDQFFADMFRGFREQDFFERLICEQSSGPKQIAAWRQHGRGVQRARLRVLRELVAMGKLWWRWQDPIDSFTPYCRRITVYTTPKYARSLGDTRIWNKN